MTYRLCTIHTFYITVKIILKSVGCQPKIAATSSATRPLPLQRRPLPCLDHPSWTRNVNLKINWSWFWWFLYIVLLCSEKNVCFRNVSDIKYYQIQENLELVICLIPDFCNVWASARCFAGRSCFDTFLHPIASLSEDRPQNNSPRTCLTNGSFVN